MILNENLFEDVIPTEEGKEWEKYYGKFVVKFPVDDNVRTSQIEEMVRTNISKYTNGEVEDIDVFYASEVDEDKFLDEDWRDGEFTDEDFEDWSSKKYDDIYRIVRSARTISKNHPERKKDILSILQQLINVLSQGKDNIELNESLKEAIEDFSNGSPLAGEDSGVASMLNALIKSEWDAIDDYNGAIATLSSTDEDYAEMINVLTDIAKEEHTHVGQLTEIMKIVSPNVEEQDKGREEAAGQLEEPVPVEKEEITEAKKAPASDPLKIERAEMSCLSALRNGATATEQIIQEVKWIYGISYDEAKEAFKKAHNKYMVEEEKGLDDEDLDEDYVFYKPDKEGHLNFNPLVLGSSLELGDEVYDSKTGHKLKVDSEPIDFKYSRRITFLDLDTNEHKTQDVGIQSLWTKVVEGDTAEEVDDDLDIEWHPIDQYFKGELDEDKQSLKAKYKNIEKDLHNAIEDCLEELAEYDLNTDEKNRTSDFKEWYEEFKAGIDDEVFENADSLLDFLKKQIDSSKRLHLEDEDPYFAEFKYHYDTIKNRRDLLNKLWFKLEYNEDVDESLKESIDTKSFYQMIIDTKGNPSIQDFVKLGYTEGEAIEKVTRMASNKANPKIFVEIAKKKLKELDKEESLKEDKEKK